MKKLITFTTTGLLAASASIAGTVAYVAPPVDVMAPSEPMGSSGAWIIPLIAIGLIALAISTSSSDNDGR